MKTAIPSLAASHLLLFLFHFVTCTSSAKILSISFFSSKSHKLTSLPLLEELGRRGHQVTIVSPIRPLNPKPAKNVQEIHTMDWEEIESSLSQGFTPFEPQKSKNPFLMLDFFTELCTKSYNLPQIQALLKQKFDLIFLQLTLNDCLLGLIYKLQAPMIIWSPASISGSIAEKIGGHFPPAVVPNVFIGFHGEMNFFQRFLNFGFNFGFEALLGLYYEPHITALYRNILNDTSIPSVREIMRDHTAMVLSSGHFSLQGPKPFYPDVVDVGGILSRPAKPLPTDLEEFIQKGKEHGFIYFSMGSLLTGSKMPEEKRKMFIGVFAKLKQQVLWKWETERMPDLPKNVKLSKWLPQQDLLGHPQIKMFITHCGGNSIEEAVYHGTALLGMPMFGNQHVLAKLAKSHGFIVELDWNDITEERLMNAVQQILKNPQYKDNVKNLSNIFRDQQSDPLERAVFWMEYVIRHKGAPHLRNSGRKLNLFQYHSYDVMLAYLVIIGVMSHFLFKLVKIIVLKIVRCINSIDIVDVQDNKKSKEE